MADKALESGELREAEGEGPIVSVVDDDGALCDALADLFDAAGYRTRKFNDAEGFLSSGAAQGSSVLITDIQLDGMDGLALMTIVADLAQRLPVIVITGRPEEEFRRRANAQGCAAFLRKPFDPVSLLGHVEAALAHG